MFAEWGKKNLGLVLDYVMFDLFTKQSKIKQVQQKKNVSIRNQRKADECRKNFNKSQCWRLVGLIPQTLIHPKFMPKRRVVKRESLAPPKNVVTFDKFMHVVFQKN